MAELIWDGKYDEHGHKRAPVRIELPFQTVETVNESVQDRQRTLELSSSGNDPEWRNRLIWGDKKYVLPSLLPEFAGKVDLIYIDPPFNAASDFSFRTTIPESDNNFTKEPSLLEQKAYRDTWGRGLQSYLQWFYEAALFLRELLAEKGTLYVHLDWHVGHYAKAVLDEIFGPELCQNEIIWKRTSARSDSHTYNHIHDTLFLFTKGEEYTYNFQYTPYDQTYLDNFYRYTERDGRRFRVSDLMAAGTRKGSSGQPWHDIDPNSRGNHWKYTIETLEKLDHEDRIYWPQKEGGVPGYKRYLDEMPGVPLQSIWTDISPIAAQATENVLYDTQKPEVLLDRIIKASSNKGDLVLDCFCGSGTTAAVAEKLNRRWIACDLGRFAIHTTRKRLLGIPGVKPFVVQNLGKYERQQWQVAEFAPSPVSTSSSSVILSDGVASRSEATPQSKDPASAGTTGAVSRHSQDAAVSGELPDTAAAKRAGTGSFDSAVGSLSRTNRSAQDDRLLGDKLREQREREAAYRKFILELYHATPVSGHVWLHGVKAGRMVHVGAVDAPVTRADVNAIAAEVWKAAGKGPNSPEKPAVDILGWDFALEVNETAKEIAAQARVVAAFKRISRDVMEKKAVEQGDVHFFELGALKVDSKIKKLEVTISLADLVIPLDDVPAEVRSAIKHWSQMVDYWAVDWDYKEDTFHNQWQSYRTRKNPKLELSVKREYAEPGEYTVVVKVIDILGNDTTKTLTVEMK